LGIHFGFRSWQVGTSIRQPNPRPETNVWRKWLNEEVIYGRIYIKFGPPDEIDSRPTTGAGEPGYEDWTYRHLDGPDPKLPDKNEPFGPATFKFVDQTGNKDYQLLIDMLPAPPKH
jgi:hypothetical protein